MSVDHMRGRPIAAPEIFVSPVYRRKCFAQTPTAYGYPNNRTKSNCLGYWDVRSQGQSRLTAAAGKWVLMTQRGHPADGSCLRRI